MATLERGGNAFDAAVAAGFALQVVEPHLNGPGGDLPIVLYSARRDAVEVICGQGVAPQAAPSRHTGSSVSIWCPATGCSRPWCRALSMAGYGCCATTARCRCATCSRRRSVLPGAGILCADDQRRDRARRDLFASEWPTSAAVYLPGGNAPAPGSLFRNPVLADTYQRILDEAGSAGGDREAQIEAARRAWYRGFVAEAIDRFCRANEVLDVTGRRHRGLLTGDDLARWQATVEAPLAYDYHGYTLCKPGPWSQAPVALQQLALLKGFDLAALSATDPALVHTVVECAKLAFADREAFYGDPDLVEVPLATLLSDAYSDQRRGLIGMPPRSSCGRGASTATAAKCPCIRARPPRTSPTLALMAASASRPRAGTTPR